MTCCNGHMVHFVGSFPVTDATQVYDAVGHSLDGYLGRLPDGEVQGWMKFIGPKLYQTKGLRKSNQVYESSAIGLRFELLEIEPGKSVGDVEFPTIGYDQIATKSYEAFKKKREAGQLSSGVRFQASIPSPFGSISNFVVPHQIKALAPAFERKMLADVAALCRAIPHNELAVQWDVCVEIDMLYGRREGTDGLFNIDYISDMLARLIDSVPAGVETGLHLCYGNPGGKHLLEPEDMGLMVALTNTLLPKVHRRINWIHMPAPMYRDDLAYYAPLTRLWRDRIDQLYIGLLHLQDGVEGARRRIAAASHFVKDFGVATECGLSQLPDGTLAQMVKLHGEVAKELQATAG